MKLKSETDVGIVVLSTSTIWLYSTGHWIGGTISLVLLVLAAAR